MFIPDPDFSHPGCRGRTALNPGFGSATLQSHLNADQSATHAQPIIRSEKSIFRIRTGYILDRTRIQKTHQGIPSQTSTFKKVEIFPSKLTSCMEWKDKNVFLCLGFFLIFANISATGSEFGRANESM
jgi:hypothetical protein